MSSSSVTLIQTASAGKPDLTAHEIKFTPDPPGANTESTIKISFKNIGDTRASGFYVYMYVDGETYHGWQWYREGIDPGAIGWYEISGHKFGSGSHTVRLVVDAQNQVSEESETNNELWKTFNAVTTSCSIQAFHGGPYSGRQGDPISFSGSFNAGGCSGSYSFLWDFDDGATSSSKTPTHIYNSAGSFVARFRVTDTVKNVYNQVSTTVTVQTNPDYKPDLTVTSIATTPDPPVANQDFKLRYDVKNEGRTSAGAFRVRLYVDGSSSWSIDHSGLGVGGSTYGEWNPLRWSQGSHTVRIVVDELNQVAESTETNNERSRSIDVVSSCSISVSTGGPYSGKTGYAVSVSGSHSATAGCTSPFSYTWEWGDGSSPSTGASTYHTYTATGSYSARLTVRDSNGKSGSAQTTITIADQCTIDVTPIFPVNGRPGQTLTFSGTYTKAGTCRTIAFRWTFGDGATSSAQNPSKSYSTEGTYSVTFTAEEEGRSSGQAGAYDTAQSTLRISSGCQIQVDPHGPYTAYAGTPFTALASFTNSGSDCGSSPTYGWTWSDGKSDSTSQSSINHAYAAAGTYSITLRVRDNRGYEGSATTTATVTAQCTLRADPLVPATGSTGATVSFTGNYQKSGDCKPLAFYWNFGDDSSSRTSSLRNPAHTYATAGTYTVTFQVEEEGRSSTGAGAWDLKQATIEIRSGCTMTVDPHGPYTATQGTPFTLLSSITKGGSGCGNSYTYTWYWGDGTSQATQSASMSHSYANAGSYSVTVRGRDDKGNEAQASTTVTVRSPCQLVGEPVVPLTGTPGASMSFVGNYRKSGDCKGFRFYWNFGDGSTSLLQNPTTTYHNAGTYTVTFTVEEEGRSSGGAGAYDLKQTSIKISSGCKFSIKLAGPFNGKTESPLSAWATYSRTGSECGTRNTYMWDWGDGKNETTSSQRLSHVYAKDGQYTLTVRARDDAGFEAVDSTPATVSSGCKLIANPLVPARAEPGTPISFVGNYEGSGECRHAVFFWDFGDTPTPGTSALQYPSYTYRGPGVYAVTFTVEEEGRSSSGSGAYDTRQITLEIARSRTPPPSDETAQVSDHAATWVTLADVVVDGRPYRLEGRARDAEAGRDLVASFQAGMSAFARLLEVVRVLDGDGREVGGSEATAVMWTASSEFAARHGFDGSGYDAPNGRIAEEFRRADAVARYGVDLLSTDAKIEWLFDTVGDLAGATDPTRKLAKEDKERVLAKLLLAAVEGAAAEDRAPQVEAILLVLIGSVAKGVSAYEGQAILLRQQYIDAFAAAPSGQATLEPWLKKGTAEDGKAMADTVARWTSDAGRLAKRTVSTIEDLVQLRQQADAAALQDLRLLQNALQAIPGTDPFLLAGADRAIEIKETQLGLSKRLLNPDEATLRFFLLTARELAVSEVKSNLETVVTSVVTPRLASLLGSQAVAAGGLALAGYDLGLKWANWEQMRAHGRNGLLLSTLATGPLDEANYVAAVIHGPNAFEARGLFALKYKFLARAVEEARLAQASSFFGLAKATWLLERAGGLASQLRDQASSQGTTQATAFAFLVAANPEADLLAPFGTIPSPRAGMIGAFEAYVPGAVGDTKAGYRLWWSLHDYPAEGTHLLIVRPRIEWVGLAPGIPGLGTPSWIRVEPKSGLAKDALGGAGAAGFLSTDGGFPPLGTIRDGLYGDAKAVMLEERESVRLTQRFSPNDLNPLWLPASNGLGEVAVDVRLSELGEADRPTVFLEFQGSQTLAGRSAARVAAGLAQLGRSASQGAERFVQAWLRSPADLLVRDENGRMVGFRDGQQVNEIPGASARLIGHEEVLTLPEGFEYDYTVTGKGNGTYTLHLTRFDNSTGTATGFYVSRVETRLGVVDVVEPDQDWTALNVKPANAEYSRTYEAGSVNAAGGSYVTSNQGTRELSPGQVNTITIPRVVGTTSSNPGDSPKGMSRFLQAFDVRGSSKAESVVSLGQLYSDDGRQVSRLGVYRLSSDGRWAEIGPLSLGEPVTAAIGEGETATFGFFSSIPAKIGILHGTASYDPDERRVRAEVMLENFGEDPGFGTVEIVNLRSNETVYEAGQEVPAGERRRIALEFEYEGDDVPDLGARIDGSEPTALSEDAYEREPLFEKLRDLTSSPYPAAFLGGLVLLLLLRGLRRRSRTAKPSDGATGGWTVIDQNVESSGQGKKRPARSQRSPRARKESRGGKKRPSRHR